jgi:hypothetical protein
MTTPILPASGTPRTDAALIKFTHVAPGEDGVAIAPEWVTADFARQLERDLQAAQRELAEARRVIKLVKDKVKDRNWDGNPLQTSIIRLLKESK